MRGQIYRWWCVQRTKLPRNGWLLLGEAAVVNVLTRPRKVEAMRGDGRKTLLNDDHLERICLPHSRL